MPLNGLLIMIVFSIPFLGVGLWSIRGRKRVLEEGYHTTALIVGAERRYDRQAENIRARRSYAPKIKFQNERGKTEVRPIPYSFNIFGGRPSFLSDGKEIEIAYLPSDRERIEPVGTIFTIIDGVLFFTGLFIDAVGILLFFFG